MLCTLPIPYPHSKSRKQWTWGKWICHLSDYKAGAFPIQHAEPSNDNSYSRRAFAIGEPFFSCWFHRFLGALAMKPWLTAAMAAVFATLNLGRVERGPAKLGLLTLLPPRPASRKWSNAKRHENTRENGSWIIKGSNLAPLLRKLQNLSFVSIVQIWDETTNVSSFHSYRPS